MSPLVAAASFTLVDGALVVAVVVLLVASAFLALAETSLVRMTRAKAAALADAGRRGSRDLVRLTENPQGFLNPVLLLVLICQLVVATVVGLLASSWFGVWGVLVATVFEIVAIFVLGEAVPKNWAVHHPEQAALFSAPLVSTMVRFPPIRMLSNGLIGLANLLIGHKGAGHGNDVTESELLAMADVALEDEAIETEERALIHSIIEFGDTVVREVMVPRPDMVAIESDELVEAVLERALAVGYSRLPVLDPGSDDVVGITYTKDLIGAARSEHGHDAVLDHMRTPHFVPETKRVSSLMREMQAETFHLAIVVNEYGGTAGLVTLEDLIEELVGEIVDEFDVEEPPVERLPGGDISVSGRMVVTEANELFDARLPTGTWDTVGGLLFDLLGHVPEVGEGVEIGPFRLVADRVSGRRIERVRITPPAGSGVHDESGAVIR